MADLRGQQLKDSYQNVITDSGSDLAGIENGNGADITGRIVERGSNSDGEWVRFADGTQKVWNNNISTQDIDEPQGDGFRSTNAMGWTFPQAFVSTPNVVSSSDGTGAWVGNAEPNSTSVSARMMAFIIIENAKLKSQAIGRWK